MFSFLNIIFCEYMYSTIYQKIRIKFEISKLLLIFRPIYDTIKLLYLYERGLFYVCDLQEVVEIAN